MGKTIIFGGTFNPVHTGHVQMAQAAAALPETEELLVMPTRLPVHKFVGAALAPAKDRMQMCRLAFSDIPGVRFSDMELVSGGKNYSITTVRALKSAQPEKNFVFLLGGDSLIHFHEWYEYRALLREIPLYVFGRGSCAPAAFEKARRALCAEGGDITVIETEICNVSSSEIRERIQIGRPITGLVPAPVEAYIRRHELYREANGFDS